MAEAGTVQGAAPGEAGQPAGKLDRLASFRFTYLAILVFVFLYVFTVEAAESLLGRYFQQAVEQAVRVDPAEGPVSRQIRERIHEAVRESAWVRIGGLRVTPIVLSFDGQTPLYLGGAALRQPVATDPLAVLEEAKRLLPATAEVVTSIPPNSVLHNAILLFYAALLVQVLFVRSRRLARAEQQRLSAAIEARDHTAARAASIEGELTVVRQQLAEIEPVQEGHSEEIRALEQEREQLQRQLDRLAAREVELRAHSDEARRLDEERRTLEQLLEEAVSDLDAKDGEIRSLQARLKKVAKASPAGGRGREGEQLARRLRTLYKNLEIDDRAVQDLVALRDESMKLKAEESLKRLSDESEQAAIRRKVGGLPPHLSIFELGFAGKGRIYYTRGRQRRFRVLLVGAKNTQKPDLEYLSRLPKGT